MDGSKGETPIPLLCEQLPCYLNTVTQSPYGFATWTLRMTTSHDLDATCQCREDEMSTLVGGDPPKTFLDFGNKIH